MHPSLGFLFGVLLRCSSTVAVLLGSPAPLFDVAPCDFTYLFTSLPLACLLLIADCDGDSAHVLPRALLTCRTGLGLGLGLGWGLGCLNVENNPRWVVSPPGPALL